MGLNRNVPLSTALRYKGQGTYIAFIMHRIGGSALFIFFTLYILTLTGVDAALTVLNNWLFQLIFVPFALFHAINGLRITILDLWPGLIPQYRKIVSAEWAIYAIAFCLVMFAVLRGAFGG